MIHGSLFSGIGGFDLAAEWAGWKNTFQVEWNPFCQKVLKKNFPDANIYGDIKEFDGKPWRGTVDVISGGFPCQPYSNVGKRLGKEDERHLWPEMLRVILDVAPRWVVGENVRGLISWSGGLVFDEVQSDLEASGYEVQAFLLPASSAGAPHQRQRIWFIAYSNSDRKEKPFASKASRVKVEAKYDTLRCVNIRDSPKSNFISDFGKFPTFSPVLRRDDGVSNWMDRNYALGNAVVPQLVWRIFDTINLFECQRKNNTR